MATASCTSISYKHYNGGWSDWSSSLYGGYAGNSNSKLVTVLRFKTPSNLYIHSGTKFNITVPYVRQTVDGKQQADQEGYLYFKLYSNDPTGAANSTNICAIPNASTCDASKHYNKENFQADEVATVTIKKDNLKANTYYYLVIGCSQWHISIGYYTSVNQYAFKFEYTEYTLGSAPTVKSIKDNGDNTATIEWKLGKNGTNNKMQSATLYYTIDKTNPSSSSSRKTTNLAATSELSASTRITLTEACTVRAYIVCKFVYNETNSGSSSSAATSGTSVTYYVKPNKPGVPILSYKKSRLTIKEPWTFTWTASAAGNKNSPVAGYYLMLLKKAKGETDFKYICKLTDAGNSYLGLTKETQTDTNYYLRRESSSCKAIIEDPAAFGFNPGDEVKLRVRAYTWNGSKQVIQSDAVDSADYLVQNAGIVHIKVNGNWKEGQVYVKVSGEWKEAQSVSTKVNGTWKESQ